MSPECGSCIGGDINTHFVRVYMYLTMQPSQQVVSFSRKKLYLEILMHQHNIRVQKKTSTPRNSPEDEPACRTRYASCYILFQYYE
ncbi:hypothetical protein F511_37115 [Dorcoceras hygrometricum]|uniref:Uncharacterized protein n=1 Tax=Dorcoceras hygrometricum TaxID=472368 RepID=A0A2Z7D6M7_9LAMI|nr:hypothetical protein F511_37115 [Dorcoceras hygrometricum]